MDFSKTNINPGMFKNWSKDQFLSHFKGVKIQFDLIMLWNEVCKVNGRYEKPADPVKKHYKSGLEKSFPKSFSKKRGKKPNNKA